MEQVLGNERSGVNDALEQHPYDEEPYTPK